MVDHSLSPHPSESSSSPPTHPPSSQDANAYAIGKNYALFFGAGDRAAFFGASFFGAQDTVYTGFQRAYFADSWINGSSDFLYGQGAAVWERCTIVGEPGERGWSFLTAHTGNVSGTSSAGSPSNRTAYLIKDSKLPAAPGARDGATWLGRPWGTRATVVYVNAWMDRHIASTGWNSWYNRCSGDAATCADIFYAEFNSSGPGANAAGRVSWSHQLTADEAAAWTVTSVLHGWTPPEPPTSRLSVSYS